MMDNPKLSKLYNFLKEKNQLGAEMSEQEFIQGYGTPEKLKEVYRFMRQNKLITDGAYKDADDFASYHSMATAPQKKSPDLSWSESGAGSPSTERTLDPRTFAGREIPAPVAPGKEAEFDAPVQPASIPTIPGTEPVYSAGFKSNVPKTGDQAIEELRQARLARRQVSPYPGVRVEESSVVGEKVKDQQREEMRARPLSEQGLARQMGAKFEATGRMALSGALEAPEYIRDVFADVTADIATAGMRRLVKKGEMSQEQFDQVKQSLRSTYRDVAVPGTPMHGMKAMENITDGMGLDEWAARQRSVAKTIMAQIENSDQNFESLMNAGDYSGAMRKVAIEGFGSLPYMMMAMVPGVGPTAVGLSAGKSKYEQLLDEGHEMNAAEAINSVLTGAFEGITEAVSGAIGRQALRMATKFGKEIAVEGTKKALMAVAGRIVGSMAEEALSETMAQFAENIVDKATVDRNKNILEGLLDAAVIGAASGGGVTSAGASIGAALDAAPKLASGAIDMFMAGTAKGVRMAAEAEAAQAKMPKKIYSPEAKRIAANVALAPTDTADDVAAAYDAYLDKLQAEKGIESPEYQEAVTRQQEVVDYMINEREQSDRIRENVMRREYLRKAIEGEVTPETKQRLEQELAQTEAEIAQDMRQFTPDDMGVADNQTVFNIMDLPDVEVNASDVLLAAKRAANALQGLGIQTLVVDDSSRDRIAQTFGNDAAEAAMEGPVFISDGAGKGVVLIHKDKSRADSAVHEGVHAVIYKAATNRDAQVISLVQKLKPHIDAKVKVEDAQNPGQFISLGEYMERWLAQYNEAQRPEEAFAELASYLSRGMVEVKDKTVLGRIEKVINDFLSAILGEGKLTVRLTKSGDAVDLFNTLSRGLQYGNAQAVERAVQMFGRAAEGRRGIFTQSKTAQDATQKIQDVQPQGGQRERAGVNVRQQEPLQEAPAQTDTGDRAAVGGVQEEIVRRIDDSLDRHYEVKQQLQLKHGTWTPDIKEFSLKYVNTGEGAQFFGWGLYFTDKESVAEWYARSVSEYKVGLKDGKTVSDFVNATYPAIKHIGLDREVNKVIRRITYKIDVNTASYISTINSNDRIDELRAKLDTLSASSESFFYGTIEELNALRLKIEDARGMMIDRGNDTTFIGAEEIADAQATVTILNGILDKIEEFHSSIPDLVYFIDLTGDANLDSIRDDINSELELIYEKLYAARDAFKSTVSSLEDIFSGADPSIYTVTIHGGRTPDEYLYAEWYQPIVDQPRVLNALKRSGIEELLRNNPSLGHYMSIKINIDFQDITYKNIYEGLVQIYQAEKGVSEKEAQKQVSIFMLANGIDGTQYPEGTVSGRRGGGTNYVLYDDSHIEIEAVESERKGRIELRQQKQSLEDIKAKSISDGTFMMAPNGQPTNLTEQQWLQVRTPEFKEWFGDWENDPTNASKVVDANGEPMVVYHGSRSDTKFAFPIFNVPDEGVFFSSDKNTAAWFSGNSKKAVFELPDLPDNMEDMTYKELLNWYTRNIDDSAKIEEVVIMYDESFPKKKGDPDSSYRLETNNGMSSILLGYDKDSIKAAMIREVKSGFYSIATGRPFFMAFLNIKNPETINANGSPFYKVKFRGEVYAARQISEIVKSEGVRDGVIIKDNIETTQANYGKSTSFIVFDPNQIKSATDNVGTFSKESADIRQQKQDDNPKMEGLKSSIKAFDDSDFALKSIKRISDFHEEAVRNFEALSNLTFEQKVNATTEALNSLDVNITKENWKAYLDFAINGGELNAQDLIDLRNAIKRHFDDLKSAVDSEFDSDPTKSGAFKKWESATNDINKRYYAVMDIASRLPNSFGLEGDINATEAYHFTDAESLLSILESNTIWGEGETSGVSTTTNAYFDHPELTQVQAYGVGNKPTTFAEKGIRIDLNLLKLKEDKFRVRKGNEHIGTFEGEEELRVGSWQGIENASKYINKIQVDRKIINKEAYDQIVIAAKNLGIPVVEKTNYDKPIRKIKDSRAISEAYHKAKADGIENDLTVAIELLLGNKVNDRPAQVQTDDLSAIQRVGKTFVAFEQGGSVSPVFLARAFLGDEARAGYEVFKSMADKVSKLGNGKIDKKDFVRGALAATMPKQEVPSADVLGVVGSLDESFISADKDGSNAVVTAFDVVSLLMNAGADLSKPSGPVLELLNLYDSDANALENRVEKINAAFDAYTKATDATQRGRIMRGLAGPNKLSVAAAIVGFGPVAEGSPLSKAAIGGKLKAGVDYKTHPLSTRASMLAQYSGLDKDAAQAYLGEFWNKIPTALKDDAFYDIMESEFGYEAQLMAAAVPAGVDVRKQIIGENAQLSENVRNNLAVARGMESVGKSATAIKVTTGWEKGADFKWRYELPSTIDWQVGEMISDAVDFAGEWTTLELGKLKNLAPNYKVIEMYPSIGEISVVFDKDLKSLGQYNESKGAIILNPDGRSKMETASTFYHEVQHAIQSIEGFARGTNVKFVKFKMAEAGLGIPSEKEAYSAYKRFAGEVEARNVQTRMLLLDSDRRRILLEATEDVAREDQILFFGGGLDIRKQKVSPALRAHPNFKAARAYVKQNYDRISDREIVKNLEATFDLGGSDARELLEAVSGRNYRAPGSPLDGAVEDTNRFMRRLGRIIGDPRVKNFRDVAYHLDFEFGNILAPMRKMQREIEQKTGILMPGATNAYDAMQLYVSASLNELQPIVEWFMGAKKSAKSKAESFTGRLKKVGGINRFNDFLIALHMPERLLRKIDIAERYQSDIGADIMDRAGIPPTDPGIDAKAQSDATLERLLLKWRGQENTINNLRVRYNEALAKQNAFIRSVAGPNTQITGVAGQMPRIKELDPFFELFDELRQKVFVPHLNNLLEMGAIDQNRYEHLLNGTSGESNVVWHHYVPLMYEEDAFNHEIGITNGERVLAQRGLLGLKKPYTKEKAVGEYKLEDQDVARPLDLAFGRLMASTRAKHRQDAIRRFARLVEQHGDPKRVRIFAARNVPKTDKYGNVIGASNLLPAQVLESSLPFYEGGKVKYIYFTDPGDPLYQMFQSQQEAEPVVRGLMAAMGAVMNLMRLGITSLSLSFIPANFLRDVQESSVNMMVENDLIKVPKKTLMKNWQKRWFQAAAHQFSLSPFTMTKGARSQMDQYFAEYLSLGASMSWNFDSSEILYDLETGLEGRMRATERQVARTKRVNVGGKEVFIEAASSLEKAKDIMMSLSARTENVSRLAAYAALRDAGVDPIRAASVAKNISINFEKKGKFFKGQIGRLAMSMYLFLNAGLQSQRKMIKAVSNPSGRAALAFFGVMSMGMRALMHSIYRAFDDDEEEKRDENGNIIAPDKHALDRYMNSAFMRQYYTMVANPFKPTDPLLVPRPYGALRIVGLLSDGVVDMSLGKRSALSVSGDMLSAVQTAVDPLGGTLIPTAFKPIYEASINRDWMGRQILFSRSDNRMYAQANRTTPEIYKKAAELIYDVTPFSISGSHLEHVVDGYARMMYPLKLVNSLAKSYNEFEVSRDDSEKRTMSERLMEMPKEMYESGKLNLIVWKPNLSQDERQDLYNFMAMTNVGPKAPLVQNRWTDEEIDYLKRAVKVIRREKLVREQEINQQLSAVALEMLRTGQLDQTGPGGKTYLQTIMSMVDFGSRKTFAKNIRDARKKPEDQE